MQVMPKKPGGRASTSMSESLMPVAIYIRMCELCKPFQKFCNGCQDKEGHLCSRIFKKKILALETGDWRSLQPEVTANGFMI